MTNNGKYRYKPSPGGVMYVLLQFDKTTPSLTIPIPSLFALPSNPILITIITKLGLV